MKFIKLDARHNLYRRGFSYAFVFSGFTSSASRTERLVHDIEKIPFLTNTFRGKQPKYGPRPYYVGFNRESTSSAVMLLF